jgi:hypothetical protein
VPTTEPFRPTAPHISFDIRRCVAPYFAFLIPFIFLLILLFLSISAYGSLSSPLRLPLMFHCNIQRLPYVTQSAFSDLFTQITRKLIKFYLSRSYNLQWKRIKKTDCTMDRRDVRRLGPMPSRRLLGVDFSSRRSGVHVWATICEICSAESGTLVRFSSMIPVRPSSVIPPMLLTH